MRRTPVDPRSIPCNPSSKPEALRKRFGRVEALRGLDLVADSGHVTALLGPNGAGKTTFVSAVATLLAPDAGELRVAGIDAVAEPRRVRRVIGLAGPSASVERAMTGRENVRWVARRFGLTGRDARTAADEVLERLGLSDAGDRLVRSYSGGMRRRLDLGASLVGRPQILLHSQRDGNERDDARSRTEHCGSLAGGAARSDRPALVQDDRGHDAAPQQVRGRGDDHDRHECPARGDAGARVCPAERDAAGRRTRAGRR